MYQLDINYNAVLNLSCCNNFVKIVTCACKNPNVWVTSIIAMAQAKAATEATSTTRQVTILAHEDRRPISSFIVTPTGKQADIVLVLAPATAVPCRFYVPYLQFLVHFIYEPRKNKKNLTFL